MTTTKSTHRDTLSRGRMAVLSLGALGVVFGDIGTSPLYAFREALATDNLLVARESLLGIASLMFWAMTIIVTIKYLLFVMRADNHGEGGILALTSLVAPRIRSQRTVARRTLVAIGLFGTALLYGDGMITPAISVLSAVEGLEIATPALGPYVQLTAAVILLVLFRVQRRGTATIGAMFGPVMIVWFTTLAVLGLVNIVGAPEVIRALSPTAAVQYLVGQPGPAFRSLGTVFLVVTGSEALYADMGHFGARPIRIGWFFLVLPALTLNYLGQAALVTGDLAAVDNPFYRMAPEWSLVPLVLLATLATVIASQALITGAYSLTMQAVQLGYLPRVEVDHTSPRQIGQVYVPSVNRILMIACIGLVFAFGSSGDLAAAYGVAVTTTMVITTVLMYWVMRHRWRWAGWLAAGVTAVFAAVDLAFFAANVLKIAAGGWFPLVIGFLAFSVMTTWQRGRRELDTNLEGNQLQLERFIGSIAEHPQQRTPGTAVFMSRSAGTTPPALLANLRANEVLHETNIVVSVRTADTAVVPLSRRAAVHELGEGFFQVVLTFGFIEDTDVPRALDEITKAGFGFDPTDAIYFLGQEALLVDEEDSLLGRWRSRLFALLHRNATSAALHFSLPASQTLQLGTRLTLS